MQVYITPSELTGEIKAIASKSDAHRAIICAVLADKKTSIYISEISEDIKATLECIKSMGAEVIKDGNRFDIFPVTDIKDKCTLNCNESGSTLRFLLPVLAALGKEATFTGKGRLPKRPMSPIINLLKEKGIEFSSEILPLSLNGELKAGEFKIDGNISSQFISGLMFATSVLSGKSNIVLLSELESRAYVDMTVSVLEKFGVIIKKTKQGYEIEGRQRLLSPGEYIVEGDWSNAAFFIVGAALAGNVKITGLDMGSKQSDKVILDILKLIGVEFIIDGDTVSVKKSEIKPFDLDVSECPDLFPILAVLASGAKGKTTLYNARRLRIKESDRITSTKELILGLGGKAEETEESLIIYGTGKLVGGNVKSFNDHRIAMSAFIASCICDETIVLDGAEAVKKSYPDFFAHFKSLGGKANVI